MYTSILKSQWIQFFKIQFFKRQNSPDIYFVFGVKWLTDEKIESDSEIFLCLMSLCEW